MTLILKLTTASDIMELSIPVDVAYDETQARQDEELSYINEWMEDDQENTDLGDPMEDELSTPSPVRFHTTVLSPPPRMRIDNAPA